MGAGEKAQWLRSVTGAGGGSVVKGAGKTAQC